MPRPQLKLIMGKDLVTIGKAAKLLELSPRQLERRINWAVLPPPTLVDTNSVRYFSSEWILAARETLLGLEKEYTYESDSTKSAQLTNTRSVTIPDLSEVSEPMA